MDNDRHFHALCLCLCGGVAAGIAAAELCFPYLWALASAVSACLYFFAMLCLRSRPQPVRLCALFFIAGMFCAVSSAVSEPFAVKCILPGAGRFAQMMKDTVNSIPYHSPDTPGIVQGLLTGDRNGISRELRDIFRRSGASHILALSGLHLGIIYSIVISVLRPLGNSPAAVKSRSLLCVALCGFYASATGFGPSISRAFTFIALNELLKCLNRKKRPLRVFMTALSLQLAMHPQLIRDLGFQLSYLAMAGITLLYPILDSWYPSGGHGRLDVPRRLWQAAALSVSCQIFTGPLSYLRFGTFPRYFLLTNILAMPVTTAVMLTSVAATGLSAAGLCPEWLVTINEKTVSLLLRILTVISQM